MDKSDEKPGILLVIKAIIKNRRAVYWIVTAGILASIAAALLIPKKYTAAATILPSGGGGALSKLSSLVASQSPAITAKIPENSSILYPTVLSSRHLLRKLVESEFELNGETLRLSEIIEGRTLDDKIKKLRGIAKVTVDTKTQVIKVKATTPDPTLSASIVNRMLELLDEFNREKNERRALLTYGYLKRKLEEAKGQLYEAEKALMQFEKTHMDYTTSTDPEVLMQHQKLSRELELKETSYVEILKEMELAKIELKREAAVVKVLDPARPPSMKSAPRRKLIVLLGGLLTSLFSLTYCILREIPLALILQRFS